MQLLSTRSEIVAKGSKWEYLVTALTLSIWIGRLVPEEIIIVEEVGDISVNFTFIELASNPVHARGLQEEKEHAEQSIKFN